MLLPYVPAPVWATGSASAQSAETVYVLAGSDFQDTYVNNQHVTTTAENNIKSILPHAGRTAFDGLCSTVGDTYYRLMYQDLTSRGEGVSWITQNGVDSRYHTKVYAYEEAALYAIGEVSDRLGHVAQNAGTGSETGSYIIKTWSNGRVEYIPVTLSMLSVDGAAISTATARTVKNVTVTYNGVVLCDNYTLNVGDGNYATNEYAELQYVDVNGTERSIELDSPTLNWVSGKLTIGFYEVDQNGNPIKANGTVTNFNGKNVVNKQDAVDINLNTGVSTGELESVAQLQSIQMAFKTQGDFSADGTPNQDGVKDGAGGAGLRIYRNGTKYMEMYVKSATDMYYDLTDLVGQHVIIYNYGTDGILSITNIKTTYTDASASEASAANVLKVSTRVGTLALDALNAQDEQLPEQPDDNTPNGGSNPDTGDMGLDLVVMVMMICVCMLAVVVLMARRLKEER